MNQIGKDTSLLALLDSRVGCDAKNTAQLLDAIYPELRQIAARQMLGERANHTLQATALINEAFIRLSGSDVNVNDGVHLKALLALTMRRVLLDHARAKASEKRGGKLSIVFFDDERIPGETDDVEVEALNGALHELQAFDQRAANAICLHYFGGMTYSEISEFLSVSEATVHKDLRMAKAWLATQIKK